MIKSYLCEDEKLLKHLGMDTKCWILCGWLLFDVLIFLWAWWDDFYYSHDLGRKFKRLKEELTEE